MPADASTLTKLVNQITLESMVTQVNLYEAKTHLSDLVERAAQGEQIVIAKAGRAMVRLVPVVQRSQPRRFGTLKGKVVIGADFDEPLTDMFE